MGFEEYHPFRAFFEEPKKEAGTFSRIQQIQSVSTSRERAIACQMRRMSPIQHEISHRGNDLREMFLLSAAKLFQDVGYVRASIHRIAYAVSAPKGTFYNYFRSKEELASILVDRQFAAIYQSLSLAPMERAYDQLKQHFHFLAMEPPIIAIAPLQLLATFAAEAPAIPPGIRQRIADGTHVWDRQLGELISIAHMESGTSAVQGPQELASLLITCWYGAVIRRKSNPSLNLADDFVPFALTLLSWGKPKQ